MSSDNICAGVGVKSVEGVGVGVIAGGGEEVVLIGGEMGEGERHPVTIIEIRDKQKIKPISLLCILKLPFHKQIRLISIPRILNYPGFRGSVSYFKASFPGMHSAKGEFLSWPVDQSGGRTWMFQHPNSGWNARACADRLRIKKAKTAARNSSIPWIMKISR